jgi:hypothetical protein
LCMFLCLHVIHAVYFIAFSSLLAEHVSSMLIYLLFPGIVPVIVDRCQL